MCLSNALMRLTLLLPNTADSETPADRILSPKFTANVLRSENESNMSLKYYIPEHGEGPDDARDLLSGRNALKRQSGDPQIFAEEAAEYCQNRRDGWEWSWPVVFVILDGEKEVGRFEVHRDYDPVFSASATTKTDDQLA